MSGRLGDGSGVSTRVSWTARVKVLASTSLLSITALLSEDVCLLFNTPTKSKVTLCENMSLRVQKKSGRVQKEVTAHANQFTARA